MDARRCGPTLAGCMVDLEAYGYDEHVAAAERALPAGGVIGRVTRVDRGVHTVVTAAGERPVSLSLGVRAVRDPVDRPAIGDWVTVDAADQIVARLERRSAFVRGDIDRLRAQVVAANVDVVFVVHSADTEPNARRLERELVLAWQSGAKPVLVVNKADAGDAPAASAALAPFAPDVEVLVTSALTGAGVERIAAFGVASRTLAFIGASGVGKSTLVNALLGAQVQATRDNREHDGRGRHTTVARALFVLPGGGVLIDTPGLRSVGLWRSDEALARAFSDIELLARGCRFGNCTHDHEPACVVRGRVDAFRLAHWRQLHGELDALDAEAQARQKVVKQQQRAAGRASRLSSNERG